MDSNIKYTLYKFVRQGVTFRKILNSLRKSQYYTLEELEHYQNEKLRKLINHCVKNVPFYTDMFKKLRLTPDDIRTKYDLQKLPVMDKNTVKENFDRLIATNRLRLLASEAETSGTTGIPSRFLRDYYSINFENAALWRFWENAGDSGLRRITLRGELIVPVERKSPPFWEYVPANRELLMSSYHLLPENAREYIAEIMDFKPEIAYAYPSSIYLLAKLVREHKEQINLKAIFTSSENVTDGQRRFIESTFGCRIYDWYGQVERVAAIGQCEKGTYHIIEDYSIAETLPTKSGLEIVGTNLNNYIMPLIRFRTADIIELSGQRCLCGRNFREVSRIHGREMYYIYSPEGKKISLFLASDAINFENNIDEVQFVQERMGELIVNVVKNHRFKQTDKEEVIRLIKGHTTPDMHVIVNEVEKIPRGPNGKVLNIINKVNGF